MATTTKRIVAVNPTKKKTMAKTKSRTRRNPARRRTTRRRTTRRANPMHPALLATLGGLAGGAAGAGADIGLRYTTLSPYARGGILLGTGLVGGIALSFLDPTLAAGVSAGFMAPGGAEVILQATAPKTDDEASAAAQIGAVKAELGRVRAELAQTPAYPALDQGDPNSDAVYIDEEDLAYLA